MNFQCCDQSKYLNRLFSFHTFMRIVNTPVKWKPIITTLQWSALCFLTPVPWVEWQTKTDLVRSNLPEYHQGSKLEDWIQLMLHKFAGLLLCVKYCVLFWIPLILKDVAFILLQPTFISPLFCIRLCKTSWTKTDFPQGVLQSVLDSGLTVSVFEKSLIFQSSWKRNWKIIVLENFGI